MDTNRIDETDELVVQYCLTQLSGRENLAFCHFQMQKALRRFIAELKVEIGTSTIPFLLSENAASNLANTVLGRLGAEMETFLKGGCGKFDCMFCRVASKMDLLSDENNTENPIDDHIRKSLRDGFRWGCRKFIDISLKSDHANKLNAKNAGDAIVELLAKASVADDLMKELKAERARGDQLLKTIDMLAGKQGEDN